MANSTQAERIAILAGIPTTREEFHERATDVRWDYGRKLLANRTVEQAYEHVYEPVCTVARDLVDRASVGGVSFYSRARLCDLLHASRRHDVLVVVAHWRGSVIVDADLTDGWPAAMVRHTANSPIAVVIDVMRGMPGGACVDFATSGRDPVARAIIVAALNHVIETGKLRRFLPQQIGTTIATHELIVETLSRDLLDDAFDGALQRGNQLELTDGLHPVAAVESAIDEDFRGLLDLSCCTSSVLGTYLKLMRQDRLRVIIGDHFIVPAPQLRLLERTLELLEFLPPPPYVEARLALSRGLADRVRDARLSSERSS